MKFSLRRAIRAGWPISAPVAVVALALWGFGEAEAGPLLLVFLTAFAGGLLFAHRTFREVDGLSRAVVEPQDGVTASVEEAMAAATRLRRRIDELAARTAELEAAIPAVLDGLPDPVLLLDAQRRVTRANPAAQEIAGRDPAGSDLAETLRDPAVLDAADAVLAGARSRSLEFQLAAPVRRDLSARVVRLAAAAEGATAMLALKDFTEMRRVEQMRADFVANASHEIRTPLATLAGCVETLQGPARDDPEAQERFLAIMQQQAERMTRLVTDLLSLSRIELNEHSAPMDLVHLPELLGGVRDGLAPKAAAVGVEVILDASPDLPPAVGDRDELWQVFQNLIDNAIKYGGEGKLVEVSCALADRGRGLRVTVRDRGPGIPREHLPRLTERFYRVDTARSRQLGGTGLGLAIVKHIVNRHRGALTVDSVMGQGSAFSVYLPAGEPGRDDRHASATLKQ